MPHSHDISPLARLVQQVDAAADGAAPRDTIPTGFPSLDELLGGGVRRGDLLVLGGDAGAGKSALALAVALRAATRGTRVAFLSGEMTPERVLERALAIESRASVGDLRRGAVDDVARAALGVAALRLRDAAPLVDRVPAGGLPALAELLRGTPDAELAVVDPLDAALAGAVARAEEAAAALRHLKRVAADTGLALLVTTDLPAHSRDRRDPRPALDDFGALGAVKQHADVVLGLYREEMYHATAVNEGGTELILLKNRNGPTSYVDLYFYKRWLRFEDMLDPDA